MGTLNMGDHVTQSEDKDIVEQNRLQALLDITEQHNKEVNRLQSRLETAEQQTAKLRQQLKSADSALKALRVHNPDRMKRHIKRLQEQNRAITGENASLKHKQKQLTQQLNDSQQALEQLRAEQQAAEPEAGKQQGANCSTTATAAAKETSEKVNKLAMSKDRPKRSSTASQATAQS